jgi:hypothetical protein
LSTPLAISNTKTSTSSNQDTSSSAPRYCFNPNCRKLLVQGDGEAKSKYERRRHCYKTKCAFTNPLLHQAHSDRYRQVRESRNKDCVVCGKNFHQSKQESPEEFEKRETCSRVCVNERRKQKTDERDEQNKKTCVICGRTFTRKKYKSGRESLVKFAERDTCSPRCGHDKRIKTLGYDSKKAHTRTTTVKPRKKKKTPPPPPPPEPPREPTVKIVRVWRPASLGGPFDREEIA